MSRVKNARKALVKQIRLLNDAYTEEAYKGCQPPEDWPIYEKDLERAKKRTNNAIDRLIMAARDSGAGL